MSRLRIAVVGTGHLGAIHARLLSTLESVELVGIVDPDPDARQRAEQTLQIPAWEHHAALFNHVDAAVIATPTCSHHPVAADLLDRGIHLLIEKPITESLAQADDLIARAETNHCVLQVGHVERFNAAWNAVLPEIQEPRYIEAVRYGPYSFRSTDISIVLDLMIHDIDLVLSLVRSQVVRVEAMGMALLGPREDLAHANLHFANGCVVNLSASRVSHQPQRTMRVFAPGAFANIDFATGTAQVVHPSADVLNHRADLTRCPAEQREEAMRMIQQVLLPRQTVEAQPVNAILEEQQEFVAAVERGRSVRVDGRQGRDALAVAHRILRSIETHRWNGQYQGPIGPRAVLASTGAEQRAA